MDAYDPETALLDLPDIAPDEATALPHVKICEVGPRDGLQHEARTVPTATKIAYIDRLSSSGLSMIEVSSFVHPKAIPALADAEDVFRGITRRAGVTYLALVPNMRGFERAMSCGVDAIAVFTAASQTFTQKNIGMSIEESLHIFAPIIEEARRRRVYVRAYLSMAFGCPYEGAVPIERVLEVAAALGELGIDELSIGDTIGIAVPEQVDELCERLQSQFPVERLAMHFHDTHGRALANIARAYAAGVRSFDSASGGLGGCPYAPGASGNVATEAVVDFCSEHAIDTGVDRATVVAATTLLREALFGAN